MAGRGGRWLGCRLLSTLSSPHASCASRVWSCYSPEELLSHSSDHRSTRNQLPRGASSSRAEPEAYNHKTLTADLRLPEPSPKQLWDNQQYPNCGSTNRRITSSRVQYGGPMSSASSHIGSHQSTLTNIGAVTLIEKRAGLHLLVGANGCAPVTTSCRFSTTQASAPEAASAVVVDKKTTVTEEKEEGQERLHKTLDDFQHEEIVGPTVERDTSAVADELRESLKTLRIRILGFRKGLVVLGSVQGLGACWSYFSWHSLNPTWQLVPPVFMSFLLAFILRQALQPMQFFGKLEERSRLRIVTLSLMIFKGFASFFNRARILVAASAGGVVLGLLYTSSAFLLAFLGFK